MAGGFFTTEPPGKPLDSSDLIHIRVYPYLLHLKVYGLLRVSSSSSVSHSAMSDFTAPRTVAFNFTTPWTVAFQGPLSVEFSRQEYWRELAYPTPGIFPIKVLHCRQILYHLSPQGSCIRIQLMTEGLPKNCTKFFAFPYMV